MIVAGSAGSGELTADTGRGGSDVEIAVVAAVWDLPKLRRLRKSLQTAEIYWVSSWRFRWGLQRNLADPRPTVSAFDLARQPRVGRLPSFASRPRVWMPEQLGRREAVSLLLNRVAEAMESDSDYARNKIRVACGDALLIADGSYDSGYERRRELFAGYANRVDPDCYRAILDGYQAKLSGSIDELRWPELRSLVRNTLDVVLAVEPLPEPLAIRLAEIWKQDSDRRAWARTLDKVGLLIRGTRVLGVVDTSRNVGRGRPDVLAYAKIVDAFNGITGPGPTPSPQSAVQFWRAFCY